MKGLLITNDFPPVGGGEAVWYDRLCGAVEPEHVVVLAPSLAGDGEVDRRRRYRVIRRRAPMGTHPLARMAQMILLFGYAIRVIRREGIAAVHVGHLYLGPVALALKKLTKTPYVLYLHGGEMAPYLRLAPIRSAVRAIIAEAAMVAVNSSYTRRRYEAMGFVLPRVTMLTMGVDTSRFRPGLDPGIIRTRYGLDGSKVLLTVGRLVERKGHDAVIRVLGRIRSKVGRVVYVIAGTGPEDGRLRALAHAAGCAEDVVFTGRVPDAELPQLYAVADVFVMPSRELARRDGVEGFGIVFLEAAASAKPSVGARTGGIADAIVDGETGILVDPDNLDELAETLTQLLLRPEHAAQMGGQGRRRVEQLARAWAPAVTELWTKLRIEGGQGRDARAG